MSDMKEILQEEHRRMREIRESTEIRLIQNADITGKLRISIRNGQVSYYHRLPNPSASSLN